MGEEESSGRKGYEAGMGEGKRILYKDLIDVTEVTTMAS